ncbi:MAG TPA: hypothetical protein VGQ06_13205 [Gemmatimonadales bacterium]|jgi:hypothetical protein|nr:hypothetical protein [Gemmatimonadales bacterium]
MSGPRESLRLLVASGATALTLACAAGVVQVPPTVLTPAGAIPDTVSCDRPLVVKAANEPDGIAAERRWLDTQYPGHSRYSQALVHGENKVFDVLTFTAGDGRAISVCFDITSFFGRW